MPSYSALNVVTHCFRENLRNTDIRVIELSPPVAQTELHDREMGEEKGRALGMPVNDFIDWAHSELCTGKDEIVLGNIAGLKNPADDALPKIVAMRREAFDWLSGLTRKMMGSCRCSEIYHRFARTQPPVLFVSAIHLPNNHGAGGEKDPTARKWWY